jgi:hypothetical protein
MVKNEDVRRAVLGVMVDEEFDRVTGASLECEKRAAVKCQAVDMMIELGVMDGTLGDTERCPSRPPPGARRGVTATIGSSVEQNNRGESS